MYITNLVLRRCQIKCPKIPCSALYLRGCNVTEGIVTRHVIMLSEDVIPRPDKATAVISGNHRHKSILLVVCITWCKKM